MCENAAFAPSPKALMDGLAFAVSLRQVPPGNTRSVTIDDGIDEQPVVGRGAADVAFAARQEILDLRPLVVAQGVAVHLSASSLPTAHESEKK